MAVMPEQNMIYVVDDDDAVRDSLRMLLEIHGHPVCTYSSGAALLRDELPAGGSCLLLDAHMPNTNGFEVLNQLRERGVTLPTIVMTSGLSGSERLAAGRSGSILVEKPFQPGELLAKIRRAMGQQSP